MRRLGLGAGISRRVGTRNGPALDLNFLSGALDSRVTFSRASTATRFNASGVLETVASGAPRFDYNPVTLAARGLLLEEARTNLALRSSEFDDATWTKSQSSVTANATTAPDGTLSGDKIVENAAVGVQHFVRQSVAVTSGTTYTQSIYVKAAERFRFRMEFPTAQFAANERAIYDLSTQVITNTGGSPTITSVGNGWYRLTLTGACTASASANIIAMLMPDSGSTSSYDGNGTSGIYVWGAQVEAGAFGPTSYIPTTTASATRAVDTCHVLTSAFPFNAAAGTLFAEFTPLGVTGLQTVVYLDDTTNNERMGIRSSAGTNAMLAVDDNATQVNASIGTVTAGTAYKVAMSYVLNDFAGCQNGGTVATDTVVTLPTVTRFLLGSRLSGSEVMSGHYRQARYWPTRRGNTDLQALTV